MKEIGQAVSKAKDDFLKAHGKAMQDVAAMMTPGVREHCAVYHDLKAIFDEYQALWVGNGSAEDLIRAERNIANFSFATKSDLNTQIRQFQDLADACARNQVGTGSSSSSESDGMSPSSSRLTVPAGASPPTGVGDRVCVCSN